jgi:hypothetical protein
MGQDSLKSSLSIALVRYNGCTPNVTTWQRWGRAAVEEQVDMIEGGGQQLAAEAEAENQASEDFVAPVETATVSPHDDTAAETRTTAEAPATLLPAVVTPRPPMERRGNAFPSWFARPFGTMTAALVAVCCFALVGITYSVAVLTGADWTRGVQIAADAAFALALLAVAGAALRYAAGRRALRTLGLALLLVASLAGTGAGGLLLAPGLHSAQARVLESSGRYEAAIAEYTLAGDAVANSPAIAQAYDEWAASLLRQKNYSAALSRYLLVTISYPGTGAPYHQAEAGIFATYTAWIAAGGTDVPYPSAIAYIQTYSASPACDAACQATATTIMPQAAYQFGTQLIAAEQYAQAIQQLAAVKARYPQSPYAAQAHAAAAIAYLDLGQQQLPTACADAVKSYQTLATQYADTPQGAEAKQALAAPQPVTGTISHTPTNPAPTIYLSRSAAPVSFYFSDDFHASVDPQSGAFHFASVPLGTYYLSATRDIAGGTQTVWWRAANGSVLTVRVSPLCGAVLGTLPFA